MTAAADRTACKETPMLELLEPRRHLSCDRSPFEGPKPAVSISDVTVSEVVGGHSHAVFRLTLNSQPISEYGFLAPRVVVTVSDGSATAVTDYGEVVGVDSDGEAYFTGGSMETSIAIPVTGDFEDEGTETFTVTLSCPNRLTIGDGVGVGSIVNTSPPPPVPFGGPAGPLTYTRPDRGPVVIALRGPGSGSAIFAPGAAEPGRITVDGTTPASSLVLSGDVMLPEAVVNGSLRSLGGRATDLTGAVTVSGSLSRLILDDVGSARVTVRGAGRPLSVTADQVTTLSLDSAAPIRSFRANNWEGGGTITTPLLSSLTVGNRMRGSVNAGTIGRVVVGGAISRAEIRAEGSIGSITAAALDSSRVFAGVRPDVDALPDSPDDFVNPAARIGSVAVVGPRTAGFITYTKFHDASVAAPLLGRLRLNVVSGAASSPGVAARSIRSLSASTESDALRFSGLDNPADSRIIDGFVLRLVP